MPISGVESRYLWKKMHVCYMFVTSHLWLGLSPISLTCFILSISFCVFYKYGSIWPTEVLEKAEPLFVCMCQFLTSIESVTWSQLPFHNKSHNSYTIGTSSIWTKEVSFKVVNVIVSSPTDCCRLNMIRYITS